MVDVKEGDARAPLRGDASERQEPGVATPHQEGVAVELGERTACLIQKIGIGVKELDALGPLFDQLSSSGLLGFVAGSSGADEALTSLVLVSNFERKKASKSFFSSAVRPLKINA